MYLCVIDSKPSIPGSLKVKDMHFLKCFFLWKRIAVHYFQNPELLDFQNELFPHLHAEFRSPYQESAMFSCAMFSYVPA